MSSAKGIEALGLMTLNCSVFGGLAELFESPAYLSPSRASHMLLTGSLAAPSLCLRCQLSRVILRTRNRGLSPRLEYIDNYAHRHLTTSSRRYQDLEESTLVNNEKSREPKATSWRRKYPLGRIIGKPGRRQREGLAQLRIDALEKPFEVVVLKDVIEPKAEKGPLTPGVSRSSTEISGSQIVTELAEKGEVPSQDEVDESIESLRPDTRILDDQTYEDLLRQLKDGYTTEQLSQYLTNSLNLASVESDSVHLIPEEAIQREGRLKRSPWRPGRTSLEKRHKVGTVLKKSRMRTNQTKLAQQILRLAWKLAIESREQQVGELEISLESWQVSYLFDLTVDDKPMFQNIIQSPLLRDSSEVRPYRPHNIMRVTARRSVAEEVVGQLESKLREVESLEVDLMVFKAMLGQPGWPKRLDQIFDQSDLRYVRERTMTAIERKDENSIVIHGNSSEARDLAQRVLLSLLELPSPSSISNVASNEAKQPSNVRHSVLLPENAGSDLHARYRSFTLGRLRVPTVKFSSPIGNRRVGDNLTGNGCRRKGTSNEGLRSIARVLADQCSNIDLPPLIGHQTETNVVQRGFSVPLHGIVGNDSASYWNTLPNPRALRWEAQFCKILQPIDRASDLASREKPSRRKRDRKTANEGTSTETSQPSILQPQVPGLYPLLSYFAPRPRGSSSVINAPLNPSFLTAHLMPSPFTNKGIAAMQDLPRIEIRYGLSKAQRDQLNQDYRIYAMVAILSEQNLYVPLPHEVADLRVSRRIPMLANTDALNNDDEIQRFTKTLKKSAFHTNDTWTGEPLIKIKLPRWMFEKGDLGAPRTMKKDVEVDYLLDHFEQTQSGDFVPITDPELLQSMDPEMREHLYNVPGHSYLRYRDIDGGTVGGRRTELSLRYDLSYDRMLLSANRKSVQSDGALPRLENVMSGSGMQEAVKRVDAQLFATALGFAELLTRISSGQLVERGREAPAGRGLDVGGEFGPTED